MHTTPQHDLQTIIAQAIKEAIAQAIAEKQLSLPAPANDLMRAKDVANILGTTLQAVYRLASENELPHAKIGGALFFSRNEITNLTKK